MGHGYYWACHHALETNLHTGSWWAKGSSWHPTKGLTGKAWSADLSATIRRVNSLLSRAASSLDINQNWASWFRPKDSFLGREIKKAMPGMASAIIIESEKEYLQSRFGPAFEAYAKLLEGLAEPTIPFVRELSKTIKDVGQRVNTFAIHVERVLSHRMSHVYPSDKKAKRLASKQPLSKLISELPIDKFVFIMDPSVWSVEKPFRPQTDVDEEDEDVFRMQLRTDYEKRILSLRKAGKEDLAGLCTQWADANISYLNQ